MRFIEKFADFMSGFKMSFERKLAKEHVRKVSNISSGTHYKY